MSELKQMYREGLAERVEALTDVKADLVESVPDAYEHAQRIARALRASAVTYGFPEISDAAGELEQATTDNAAEVIDLLVAVLERAVETPETGTAEVLLIEDDSSTIEEVRDRLGELRRDVRVCRSIADALVALRESDFSLIVLDLILPDGDGRDVITKVRENPRSVAVPLVVISALETAAAERQCLAIGADHYLPRPLDLDQLAELVESKLSRAAEITRDVWLDVATALPNRAALIRAWTDRTHTAAQGDRRVAMALLDLDHFAAINDQHGFGVGNGVLRHVAATIRAVLPVHDLVARWAAEEFAVLFANDDVGAAQSTVASVARRLRDEPFCTTAGDPIRVTFSAGIASFAPGTEVDRAVADIDRQVFEAKDRGGDRVHIGPLADAESKRILVAEDDDVAALHLTALLEHEGFAVQRCTDGAAALEVALTTHPDLLVLDVQMPGLTGFEVLERLRKDRSCARTPVLMLTSLGSEADVARAFELGATDYLLKPFSHTSLPIRLRRALRASQDRGGGRQ